jgi:hypothetical protein
VPLNSRSQRLYDFVSGRRSPLGILTPVGPQIQWAAAPCPSSPPTTPPHPMLSTTRGRRVATPIVAGAEHVSCTTYYDPTKRPLIFTTRPPPCQHLHYPFKTTTTKSILPPISNRGHNHTLAEPVIYIEHREPLPSPKCPHGHHSLHC